MLTGRIFPSGCRLLRAEIVRVATIGKAPFAAD
jgi:hypothetical protein